MKILMRESNAEILVKGSRFIAEIFAVKTQAQSREKVLLQKKKYSDATHIVHAFVIGLNGECCGMSDDGEPSGTAGRPVLEVLYGAKITNVLVTVTRYFGGTLLGMGGLARAYSQVAKKALEFCECEEYVEKLFFKIECNYQMHSMILHTLKKFHTSCVQEIFFNDVKLTGEIWKSEQKTFAEKICNISHGKSKVEYTSI